MNLLFVVVWLLPIRVIVVIWLFSQQSTRYPLDIIGISCIQEKTYRYLWDIVCFLVQNLWRSRHLVHLEKKEETEWNFAVFQKRPPNYFPCPGNGTNKIIQGPTNFEWAANFHLGNGEKKVRGSTRWSASEFSGHCIIGLVAIRTAAGDPAEAAGTLFHCPNFFLYFFLYFLCS